jgi:hypothetical protein
MCHLHEINLDLYFLHLKIFAVQKFWSQRLKRKSLQVKAVPFHAKEALRGGRDTALPILYPGTSLGYFQRHAPTALPPRVSSRYLFYRRLGGPDANHALLWDSNRVRSSPYQMAILTTPKHKSVYLIYLFAFGAKVHLQWDRTSSFTRFLD